MTWKPVRSIAKGLSQWRSPIAHAAVIAAAGASVFLAGGPVQGALGIFLAVAGATMFALPASRIPKWNWILGILAVVCASLSLLPATLLSIPEWRRYLEVLPVLHMAPTISVSPHETVFWLLNFASAVLVALFLLGQPVRFPSSLWLAVAAAAVCAAYAGLAAYASSTGWKYPFFEENGFTCAGFGFFPNRNQAATFLVTGCILCPGIIATGWKTRRWAAVAAGAAALALNASALLFFSSSRGGIIFLFLGLFLWLAGLGREHSSRPLWISVFSLTAMAGVFFLLSDGPARDRMLALVGRHAPAAERVEASAPPVPSAPDSGSHQDFRIPVYLDTLAMVRDFPLTGIGLGNYAWIYPFYSRLSLREEVAIHPESDWLLLATEAGPAALILLLCWVFLLVRSLLAQDRTTPGWPVRWGIAAAALTAIAHGLVDVPLHRAGLGWWILVLAGLGFGGIPYGGASRRGRVTTRRIFLPAGVLIFLLGAVLIHSQWFGGAPRAPFLASATTNRIVALSREGNLPGAEAAARDALDILPMARGLYFQLGLLLYSSGATISEVEAAFAVERALDPGRPQIPYDQGRIWRKTDPIRTAELWDEAIVRHEAIHLAGGRPDRPVPLVYQQMLSRSDKDQDLLNALGVIARRGAMYRLLWLAIPTTNRAFVERAAEDPDFLNALDEAGKRKFLGILEARCGREALNGFLNNRSGWDAAAWPILLRRMVASRDYVTAIRSVAERYRIALELPTALLDVASEPSGDPASTCAYYLQRGNTVTARRILHDAAAAGSKDAIRLQAALAMQEGNLPEAWKYLEAFLKATGRGNLP